MTSSLLTYANIIDYIRLIINLLSIFTSKLTFIILHLTASALDLIDGTVARKYNQTSILGKCLDIYNDRLGNLIIILKIKNLDNNIIFLLMIDFIANNIYFNKHLIKKTEFKHTDNIFIRLFYKIYILVPICVLTECYFTSLYIYKYYKGIEHIKDIFFIFYIFKTIFHIAMLIEGIKGLMEDN